MGRLLKDSHLPSLFNSFFPFFVRNADLESWDPSRWLDSNVFNTSKSVTMYETEKHVCVEIPLPGLSCSDIDVKWDKNVLWVEGKKKENKKDEDRKYYCEYEKSFSYQIAIPGEINESTEPEAKYENGMMYIQFSKKQPTQPKKITVTTK